MMHYKTRINLSHVLPITGLNQLLIILLSPQIPGCILCLTLTLVVSVCKG